MLINHGGKIGVFGSISGNELARLQNVAPHPVVQFDTTDELVELLSSLSLLIVTDGDTELSFLGLDVDVPVVALKFEPVHKSLFSRLNPIVLMELPSKDIHLQRFLSQLVGNAPTARASDSINDFN